MKQVRYLVGAVGLAPLAFGLTQAATAAHAATTTSQTPTKSDGKTVVLSHLKRMAPDAECYTNNPQVGYGANGLIGVASFNGSCVGFQSAVIFGRVTGLTERVRYWKNGALVTPTKYLNPGTFVSLGGGEWQTRFWSSPYYHVSEVCEAFVANGNHNDVRYGPACERP